MHAAASFGRWVKQARSALGLTQEVLADRVGCAVQTIRKIEADERRPSQLMAERLAQALELSPDDRPTFLRAARARASQDVPDSRKPPVADLPTGTVTLLFADIEGSTQLLQRLSDQYASLLGDYRRLLRTAFQTAGGQEVDTPGDAFFAAFPRARDALIGAVAAQQALAWHAWPTGVALRTRMGLHTGEPERAAGGYVGLDVHRAARLCQAAHGGQVLLSQTTRDLVAHDLPAGVELRDLGEHQLKDLPQLERIFQLVVADVPADFPPLKTHERHQGALPAVAPTNLPVQRDLLIGRESELAAVSQLLRRDDVGLVTLTGPGGTGKTRLALHLAMDLLDAFADGVWFIDLAPISDPTLVVSTITGTLGVKETGGEPVLEALKAYLRDKQLLLLLDNFEQVATAAPLLAELLKAAPQLKLLVTSRVVLHLSGEQEYAVPPLALPDPLRPGQPSPPLERLMQYSAVELFVKRARQVKPDFQLTAGNAPVVAEICARLDGLPLAIELAAARCKLFTPQALLQRLDHRFQVLTGGAQDLHARHQTLRSTIDWSYTLLDVEEQRLFARLGIFAGGCTLEAAEAVCNGQHDLEREILDMLSSLVDKSLLQQQEGAGGEPRFRMLETIREYALERLTAQGEEERLRQQHAAYFLTLAEQAEPKLIGPHEVEWLNRVEQEQDNLRAVFQWALRPATTSEQKVLGLRLAASIWWFWRKRGYYTEGRRWLATVLDATSGIPDLQAPQGATLRAKALRGAGRMALDLADNPAGQALFEEARTLSEQVGDKAGLAEALNNLGWVPTMRGDYARGIALFEESLKLYREIDDKRGVASALYTLAFAAQAQGDYAQAVALLEESQPLFRVVQDTGGLGWSCWLSGTVARLQSDYRRAVALHEEAVRLFREVGETWGLAASLESLGFEVSMRGEYARAERFHEESLQLYRAMGDTLGVGMELINLGRLARARTDYRQAVALLEESVTVLREAGDALALAAALQELAVVARDQGDYARAIAGFEESIPIYREADMKTDLAWCLEHLGLVQWLQGDHEGAATLLREGLVLMHQEGSQEGIAWGLEGLASVLADQGQPALAARLAGTADALREQMGITWEEPVTRVVFEGARARGRAQLDEGAWTAAWAEGRTLSLEQAIDHALQGARDVLSPRREGRYEQKKLSVRRRGLPSTSVPLHRIRP